MIFDGPQASLNDEEREAFEERMEIERVQAKARKERALREREERALREREERRAEPVEPCVPSAVPTGTSQALMARWLSRSSPALAV